MKKLIMFLFVGALFTACSTDKELIESQDGSADYALDLSAYDNSNLGVYKGVFSTLDSEARATFEIEIKKGTESRASLTLVGGQEVKFSTAAAIEEDVNLENVVFTSGDSSFKFSVNRDGSNPTFSEVFYVGSEGAMKAIKETSRLAVTTQTGTWGCTTGCSGSGTWNLMFTSGDGTGAYGAGTGMESMIMFNGSDIGTPDENTQSDCVDAGDITTCDLLGATLNVPTAGGPVFFEGTHSYTTAASSNCSEASGTWSAGVLSGTWTSDAVCFGFGNFDFDAIPFTPNAEGSGCATSDNIFTVADFTASGIAGSCGSGSSDVWLSFNAAATGLTITVNEGGGISSPWFTVYDAATVTEVDCIAGGGFGAVSLSGLTVGVDYLLQVSSSVDLEFCVEDFDVPTGPPANDLCGDAEAIACGDTVSGNTTTATDSDTSRGNDVWYTFDGSSQPAGTVIDVSLCGSGYDTWLGVYDDCAFTTTVTSNDDFCGGQSEVSFINDGATNYVIRVDGFNAGSFGAYDLSISCSEPPSVPDNDLCADAEAIACGDSVSGDTTAATDETGTNGNDVFYSFTGTGTAENVTVSLCGSSFDTFLRVLDSCGGGLVASNDDFCGTQSELTFASDGTSTYIIVVEAFSTGSGPYDLAVSCAPAFSGTITNVENAPKGKLTEEQQYAIWKNNQ